MSWFLGLDSSTQSLSAVIIDTDSGRVVCEVEVNFDDELHEFKAVQGVLPHADPLVKHSNPLMWVAALERLLNKVRSIGVDLGRIRGISGSGQQHGTVYLSEIFRRQRGWLSDTPLVQQVQRILTRPTSPIWMDSSTTAECAEITRHAGGTSAVRERTGSPAVERFSGPQIRKFWKESPEAYNETGAIHLVSSFMASLLVGRSAPIDVGDGAGMNLMNLESRNWDPVMLNATAPALEYKLPDVVPSKTQLGGVSPYFTNRYGFRKNTPVIAWSGDNPNSLIGVGGWEPGTAVISLGTSDTYFAAMNEPRVDPAGYGHVFGNPADGFMSLICFKNGALARLQVRDAFGLNWLQFEDCLRRTPAGNNGNMMLPYFVPEITPLVLAAKPVYVGTTEFCEGRDACTAARAVVEAQALRLRLHSAWIEEKPTHIRVTGGGAANTAICQVLADVFNAVVQRLETGNSAALGAAMRAANAVDDIAWDDLTARFSATVPGKDVRPIAANVPVYEKMLPKYAALADKFGAKAAPEPA